jgi:hypothetical protein
MTRDFVIIRMGNRPWLAIDHRELSGNRYVRANELRFPVPDDLQEYTDTYLLEKLMKVMWR